MAGDIDVIPASIIREVSYIDAYQKTINIMEYRPQNHEDWDIRMYVTKLLDDLGNWVESNKISIDSVKAVIRDMDRDGSKLNEAHEMFAILVLAISRVEQAVSRGEDINCEQCLVCNSEEELTGTDS